MEVFWLSDEASLDCSVAGAKAAGLASALRLGLPVLPGVVLAVSASLPALAAACVRGASSGPHAEKLAIMEFDLGELDDLAAQVASLGKTLVVRSSSPLESSAAYAGVFTSYLGVGVDDIATAIRGVWASAVPQRVVTCELTKRDTAPAVGMAVLVQPEVYPTLSGTAHVHGDQVTVVVVKGSPAPLLSGWARGETARVTGGVRSAFTVCGESAVALAGAAVLKDVVRLAIEVQNTLGDDHIEWAATEDGGLFLLQAKRSAVRAPVAPGDLEPVSSIPSAAAVVARLTYAFAGPLGETLLLPAVLAGLTSEARSVETVPTGPAVHPNAQAEWNHAQAVAHQLRERLWRGEIHDSTETFAQMRGGDLIDAVSRLERLPAAGSHEVAELLRVFYVIADHLVATKVIADRADFWGLPVDLVATLLNADISGEAGSVVARRNRERALRRWEPVLHTIVRATGTVVSGEAACGGTAAGPAVVVPGLPTAFVPAPRMVLIAPRPIPQLAQLLWGASALVTFGGSEAAHLVEVARSLALPTVLGCDAEQLMPLLRAGGAAEVLVAVDGTRGTVTVDVCRE